METDLFPAYLSDIDYSVITNDIIKSFDCTYMNGTCNGPRLFGPWGGAKRSNIIKSQLKSQLQRFLI